MNLRHLRNRAITAITDALCYARIDLTGMSPSDKARWAAVTTWDDLGEGVIAWLNGEVRQNPGHCGPPCAETIPLIPVLTAVNRAGLITDCSQLADTDGISEWEAWVTGFMPAALIGDLRFALAGTGLHLSVCRGRAHENHQRGWWGCPRSDQDGFWSGRCPRVASLIRDAWYVTITDPQAGRNDVLWPALAEFAGAHCATPSNVEVTS